MVCGGWVLVLSGLEVGGGIGEDAAGRSEPVGVLGVGLVVNLVVGSGVLPREEGAFRGHEVQDTALVTAAIPIAHERPQLPR